MQAAQAAGQTVSQGIGAYADMKRDDAVAALQAAKDRGDTAGLAAALADYNNWREGGDSRAELHAAGGALIGGLGGGSAFSTIGGAAGAGMSSLLAPQTKALSDSVSDATGSSLIGNLAGNIASGMGGAIMGGTAGAATASNVNLYNQGNNKDEAKARKTVAQILDINPAQLDGPSFIDQFMALVKGGAAAKMAQSPTDLAAQGAATGLSAGIGIGGGNGPTPGTGGVLINGAGQAPAAGAGSAAYQPDIATLNVQDNKAKGDAFENEMLDSLNSQYPNTGQQVTVKVGDGTRTRIDIMTRDENGTIGCVECKSSETAPLTPNQTKAFPQIESDGGVIVGKGKPGFPGGTVIPPTKVNIVRPPSTGAK
jgi:filamentous hemagglutinin